MKRFVQARVNGGSNYDSLTLPQQRLWILKVKLLPSLHHELVLANCTNGFLKSLDLVVRSCIRSWLKLPKDSQIPFFYADTRDGGLGIENLEFSIPRRKSNRLMKLACASDPLVRAVVNTRRFRTDLRKWTKQRKFKELNMSNPELSRNAWKHYLYAGVDGKGLRDASLVPEVHGWLDAGTTMMPGAKFVAAVGVRAGTLPTRSRCSRGRPDAPKHCETCGPTFVENLSHVLQMCARTHGARIKRHNHLLKILADKLSRKGWTVQVEPHFICEQPVGLRKPDLLVYKPDDQAWIIDVTVVSDTYPDLNRPHRKKMAHYDEPEIKQAIQVLTGVDPTRSSFTLNWRGIYSPESASDMRIVGLTNAELQFMAAICVEQGAIIHRIHQTTTMNSWWA